MSERESVQAKIGTPAYQVIHAADQPKSLVKESHYSGLVKPAMHKAPATMAKHLGQVPPIQASSKSFRG
jgi:hypothetical protein